MPRSPKWLLLLGMLILLGIGAHFADNEIQTSRLQAHYLAKFGRELTYTVDKGPSNSIHFPSDGPYDVRLGYALLPKFETRLRENGFTVTAQARSSPAMLALTTHGLNLPYEEKDQAGFTLFGSDDSPLYRSNYPKHIYRHFDDIPPVIVNALTFIEDRNLLNPETPYHNPAIDWGRFSHALLNQGMHMLNRDQSTPGGSTLATQIEKFRHSAGGRTATPPEKLRQIASASIRAYRNGAETRAERQQIAMHYLNTVPLAAQAGTGEIAGLGDGLAAWYGRDFDEINQLLSETTFDARGDAPNAAQALAFKQVLSLLIAQRAPSAYLQPNSTALETLTDRYLRVLVANNVISTSLSAAALATPLHLNRTGAPQSAQSFVNRKAATSLRTQLLNMLGLASIYDLDRLDLNAYTTVNKAAQQAVSESLLQAATPEGARALGLYGFRMLKANDDPSHITFSFTLFERRNGANLLRVQTDSVNQPFDINQGARLNLGSTAKLRTVITYLQIIADLHTRYASMDAAQLKQVRPDPFDPLTRWAVDYLSHTSDHSLSAMLNAAVERKYSANPGEVFYTGGGMQTFTNFDASDNHQVLNIRTALQHSVNLVFVRLMRDIVHYEMVQTSGPSANWYKDTESRDAHLKQFIDRESSVFLRRFYKQYAGLNSDAALTRLLQQVRKSPPKMAAALRSAAPDASLVEFSSKMRGALKNTTTLSDDQLAQLYEKYGPDKFDLNDRGYLAGVHPLELWVVNYLREHPKATETQARQASSDIRQLTYTWLYKTRYRSAQNERVRHVIELKAYQKIGDGWRALGYPFAQITPSFGAAVGASGDRPAALAQLIGILSSGGDLLPTQSIERLNFAVGTPYETDFVHTNTAAKPLLAPQIVEVMQSMLRSVVNGGSAGRLASGMQLADGKTLPVAGKTGTGDQRFEVYAPNHQLIESRKVSRTATFVFEIGSHFYGTITAYVREPYAADYTFTSAIAVQLLKSLTPALEPVLDENQKAGGHPAPRRVAAPQAGEETKGGNAA